MSKLVVPRGNAPRSSAYQAGALLLSYETVSLRTVTIGKLAEGVGNAPTSTRADPVFKTGAASLYLPAFRKVVLAKGISPLSPVLEAPGSIC